MTCGSKRRIIIKQLDALYICRALPSGFFVFLRVVFTVQNLQDSVYVDLRCDYIDSPVHILRSGIRLLFILEGQITLTTTNEKITLKASDIFVVNAGIHHLCEPEPTCIAASLYFPLQYFKDPSRIPSFDCNTASGHSDYYQQLTNRVKALVTHYPLVPVQLKSSDAFLGAVTELLQTHFISDLQKTSEIDHQQMFDPRIHQVLLHILTDYANAPSLQFLADSIPMSYAYLSRYFKNDLGIAYRDYITQLCLCEANDDLVYTNHSILQIAMDNGFSNINNFYRQFIKVYHCSPKDYRNLERQRIKNNLPYIRKAIADLQCSFEEDHRLSEIQMAKEDVLKAKAAYDQAVGRLLSLLDSL